MDENIVNLGRSIKLASGNTLLAERDFNLVKTLIYTIHGHDKKECSTDSHENIIGAFCQLYDHAVYELSQSKNNYGSDLRGWFVSKLLSSNHPFLLKCQQNRPEDVSLLLRGIFARQVRAMEIWAKTDWFGLIKQLCPDNLELLELNDYVIEAKNQPIKSKNRNPQSLEKLLFQLNESSWSECVLSIGGYVNKYGLPPFRDYTAFKIDTGLPNNLKPIATFDEFDLTWLEGNEGRLNTIFENTERFISGLPAQNVLVWGPRGGGKSSLIRGLISKYHSQRLRAVEISSTDYGHVDCIFETIRETGEKFIAVLDNISLDRGDDKVRDLSSAMEGGVEKLPENLIFYATSNFKDLVDRQGVLGQGLGLMQMDENTNSRIPGSIRPSIYDPQQNQRIDEMRALDDRFALKVFVDLPTKTMYERMIKSYAARFDIVADEQLLHEFNTWRMRHNHDVAGGRTVRDFIQYSVGRKSNLEKREGNFGN